MLFRSKSELEELNRMKIKFFSIIAHDLRGPLGGFMGITEMMANENSNFSEEDRKELIVELSHASKKYL